MQSKTPTFISLEVQAAYFTFGRAFSSLSRQSVVLQISSVIVQILIAKQNGVKNTLSLLYKRTVTG